MPERNRIVRRQLQALGVDIEELKRWNDARLDLESGMDLDPVEEEVQARVLRQLIWGKRS